VKKLFGLSSAEFTFLPVDRRFAVCDIKLAVFCKESRFSRTPAERVIPDIIPITFLVFVLVTVLGLGTE
jgi:hypothetical protein